MTNGNETRMLELLTEVRTRLDDARTDIAVMGERVDKAIEAGASHRQELDRRVTRLEEKESRYITWKHLVIAAGGAAGGAGGLVALLHRLLGG